MILDEYVEVNLSGSNKQYYLNKGYEIHDGDKKIKIPPNDLRPKSNIKIHAKCDVCGTVKMIPYVKYNESVSHGGYYTCKNCQWEKVRKKLIENYGEDNASKIPEFHSKAQITNIKKYGSISPLGSPEIIKKGKETLLNLYGVTHITQNADIWDKIKKTNIERYGVEYTGQIPDVIKKRQETCYDHYGVYIPAKSELIKKRIEDTNLKRYGAKNAMQSPKIKEKATKSLYQHYKCATSIQQQYLMQLYSKLYQSALNYPCLYYNLDIYLSKYKLDIEYNGGGHGLQVKLGHIDRQEFERKELIRRVTIRKQNINQMTIISRKDKLPSDEILLQMLNETIDYLTMTNHHWVEFDIDHRTVRNALGLFPYDYGKLRAINKSDIIEISTNTNQETA